MFVAITTLHPTSAAFGGLGAPEVLIIIFVLLLLFGGRKLPEMARGTGRALRIFKAETKGLMDDDDEPATAPRPSPPPAISPAPTATPPTSPALGTPTTGTGATAAPESGSSGYSAETLPPTHTET
jgi:sec-independent protein translocase protein TatA